MKIDEILQRLGIKPKLVDTVPIEHAVLMMFMRPSETIFNNIRNNIRVVKVRMKNHGIDCLPDYYDEYYIFIGDTVYRVIPDSS